MPVSATHHRTHGAAASATKTSKTRDAAKADPKPAAKATDSMVPATRSRADEVKKALLADHREVILANPAGAKDKFEKLTLSPFVFFRGTAGLFYRDLAGLDAKQPKVLCNGDVHPENFGVIQGADGKLFFGLNDFDEASPAPFTWDLRRGATAFDLAARDNKLAGGDRKKVVEAFLQGYQDAMKGFAGNGSEDGARIDEKHAPRVVEKLLSKADQQKRKDFLAERVEGKSGRFLSTPEIEPCSGRVSEFQDALEGYRRELGFDKSFLKVKDVAAKLDSGTASLGSERYYVLVEGPSKKGDDDVVLEVKQEGASVLAPYSSDAGLPAGDRVAAAERVQSPDGDPFYGSIQLGKKGFLVRERNPHKATVDLASLDAKQLREYATACGAALAQAHARSDKKDGFAGDKDVLQALDRGLAAQITRFAADEGDRVVGDFQAFKSALKKGDFAFAR